jgi:hypothetical protein
MTRPVHLIDDLTRSLFAKNWKPLHAAGSLDDPDLGYPGVYLIALSRSKLTNKSINPKNVLYVGMTCSSGGLRERIRDFKDGIERDAYHSGARRFFKELAGGKPFSTLNSRKTLYFVAQEIRCISKKVDATPADFRQLGHVACLEYYAIAHVFEKTGEKPPLNKFGRAWQRKFDMVVAPA